MKLLASRHPCKIFGSWQMISWAVQVTFLHSRAAAPLKSSTGDVHAKVVRMTSRYWLAGGDCAALSAQGNCCKGLHLRAWDSAHPVWGRATVTPR